MMWWEEELQITKTGCVMVTMKVCVPIIWIAGIRHYHLSRVWIQYMDPTILKWANKDNVLFLQESIRTSILLIWSLSQPVFDHLPPHLSISVYSFPHVESTWKESLFFSHQRMEWTWKIHFNTVAMCFFVVFSISHRRTPREYWEQRISVCAYWNEFPNQVSVFRPC